MFVRPLFLMLSAALVSGSLTAGPSLAAGVIIDHRDATLVGMPLAAILNARNQLHIAYAHTSHGSQVIDGMTKLREFMDGGGLGLSYPSHTFGWADGPADTALDIDDYFVEGDLGSPNWPTLTRTYLDDSANADVNVVMWSWCGQADTTAANINQYLSLMTGLETDYPDVTFVYMTGHVNGCSTTGNLFLRNQQIRDYCVANNKVLYDFADIESYDPDGNYYGDKLVDDYCAYDSDGDGSRDRNWAVAWQDSHKKGVDWFVCECAHSQPLNGNQKAYAAWSLWTSIAALRDPVPGDASLDTLVDDRDASILAANWQRTSGATWTDGDFNRDGAVNDMDAAILAAHWQPAAAEASVPEPSVAAYLAGLAGAFALGHAARRRR
jgi:hypothetical protein